MARGTDKKKWDGETLWNWPIPAPQIAATMAAATAIRTVIATFASTGDTSIPANTTAALTTPEGTSAFSAGYAGTSNTCVELTPNASTGRASYCKIWTADLDCYKILGNEGGQTDLIDFYVWLEEPRKVDKITIMFGLGTGTDPFIDDYYYFDFNIKNASTVNIKDSASYAAAAYTKSVNIGQSVLEPSDVTNIKTPTEVKEVLNRLGRFAGSRSRERQDSAQASPAWTHFTVTRGQFNRVGNTSGRSWSTVRGAKLIYIAVPGSTEKVRFDDLSIIGGGDRVFVGTFQCVYRFVRDNGTYLELSPVSPTSTPITLNQQTLSVSLSGAAMGFADPQVTQIWVYLFGGFLDTYYRVAVIQSQQLYSNFSLNEFDPTTDGVQDQQDMRSGIAVEFRILPGFNPTGDITLTVRKSELDVLIENVVLEPGAIGIPDNIVAIAGPWLNRLFCVTDEGYVYPTSSTSPSNCSVFHAIDLRRYGDPMWAVTTSGGVYVGFTKDVIRIAGSGDESADRSSLDLYPEPLNIGNPPVDRAVYTDGATVIYRSADGLMSLTGVTVAAVAQGVTSLLWRGYSRHNLDPLNTSTGRFRCVVDNQILSARHRGHGDIAHRSVARQPRHPDVEPHLLPCAHAALAPPTQGWQAARGHARRQRPQVGGWRPRRWREHPCPHPVAVGGWRLTLRAEGAIRHPDSRQHGRPRRRSEDHYRWRHRRHLLPLLHAQGRHLPHRHQRGAHVRQGAVRGHWRLLHVQASGGQHHLPRTCAADDGGGHGLHHSARALRHGVAARGRG